MLQVTREFLFTNEVTIDEYMAEAAKLLRSMKFGEKLEDGSCLAEDLTEEEQAELANYIYEIAYQEMIKSAGKHCLRKCDFGEYSDDFLSNFAVVIMKRLHTFNDVSCLTNKGKQYKFSTFLDELSKEATRITYAQKRGVSEHVEQRIQNVRQAMRKAMAKNMVGIDAVTPEMIAAELSRYMSTDEIIDILNISRGMISVEQHNEEAGEDTDVLESAVYIDTKIFDVLEVDVEKLFDAFFSKLSDMQKFFILVYVGCDPCYYGMTDWMTDDIYRLFLKVTGEQLSAECKPFVKEYDNGGMSSGVLSGKFWVEKGIPLLVERYHKRLKEIGLGVYSGHWVRIVDENDKVFEGFISDYFYADDNESGNESIVLENAHKNLVEFEEKDIKKITVIKK